MAKLKYLLDTHAFLWAACDDPRLGRAAARAIFNTPREQLGLSDVSIQETGLLVHSGKVRFQGSAQEMLEGLLEQVTVLPISLEIALLAPQLKLPHSDQFDRILCATASCLRIPLITKDGNITDSGIVQVVW